MQPRETRTVLVGASVLLAAFALTYVILPFARRWQTREAEIATARVSVADLRSVARNAGAVDSATRFYEAALQQHGRVAVRSFSATLAASALQSYVQGAADDSRLVVTRLDVTPTAGANASALPATLAAYGDIHGLGQFLWIVERGPRVVYVDRMTVQMNSALRGAPDVLQMTFTLRAPVVFP